MQCGNCNFWNPILQGETYNDLFKQFFTFGKVIGDCTKLETKYPMFNNEKCRICKENNYEK